MDVSKRVLVISVAIVVCLLVLDARPLVDNEPEGKASTLVTPKEIPAAFRDLPRFVRELMDQTDDKNDTDGDRLPDSVELVVGTNPVVIPRHILSFPTGLFWVQGTAGVLSGTRDQLSFYDDAAIFIRNYPDYLDPTKPGRPTAVYRQGRNLYLDYIPDATYNLIALARGSQLSALPSGGLDSYPHAMAVVTGAAWDYLLGKEDEAGVMREAAQFSVFRSLLYVESHGDYAGRTPGRSF